MNPDEAPLWKAMLEAQKKIKHAIKDSKNPHLKNKYASLNAVLDEVKPILNDNGLVLTQHVVNGPAGHVVVMTRITHAESGAFTQDQLPVPVKHKFKDGVDLGPDAQELGSAITYGRRYGLLAMCAIASEDDDGELATGTSAKSSDGGAPITSEQKSDLSKKLNQSIGWKPLGS